MPHGAVCQQILGNERLAVLAGPAAATATATGPETAAARATRDQAGDSDSGSGGGGEDMIGGGGGGGGGETRDLLEALVTWLSPGRPEEGRTTLAVSQDRGRRHHARG